MHFTAALARASASLGLLSSYVNFIWSLDGAHSTGDGCSLPIPAGPSTQYLLWHGCGKCLYGRPVLVCVPCSPRIFVQLAPRCATYVGS